MPELALQEEMETESLVRLRLITHNARLVDARKDHGITQPVMAQIVGVSPRHLRDIENLRAIPTEEEIVKIACALEKPTDYLFPDELFSAVEAGVFSRRKVELDAPQVISLTEAQHLRFLTDGDVVEKAVDRKLLAEEIAGVLDALQPKEQRVLRLRFGFDGNPMLLREVGREFNLTPQQVRQIEAKALRKLRHPARSRRLKDYLD